MPSDRRPARGPGQPALALDDGDAAALDQAGQALEEPGDDAVLVVVDAGHVDAVERGAHAELLGLAGGSATSAACSRALVGMQPTCRQVPPRLPFSTRPTVSPSWAARSAQA